ncbi:hypothetical protein A2J03_03265 [Rhodococcus sp. EPR-157]|nr:hypothetical protein A2J03_03265 [Rhodococcus sp. EPR-157]
MIPRIHGSLPDNRLPCRTEWSIKEFVTTARRYRTITISVGQQTITAADPLPEDLRETLDAIRRGH